MGAIIARVKVFSDCYSHSIVNGSEILNVTGSFDAALDDET
jgi:hypothetical protein